jgi:hypothetical protein
MALHIVYDTCWQNGVAFIVARIFFEVEKPFVAVGHIGVDLFNL